MKRTTFRFKDGDELLTSNAGLALTGLLLDKTNLKDRLDSGDSLTSAKISDHDVIRSMIGLLSIGKTHYDDIERFREDPFFKESLGVSSVPASATLRQRLDDFSNNLDDTLKEESARLLRRAIEPSPVTVGAESFVPLDIDVTPMDNSNTKKEGVSCTYKLFDGYAPIMAYLGKEGYLVNIELREGKQHCQNGTPEFLQETLWLAKSVTREKILVRVDSGNDSADNINILNEWGVSFIVKRNLRRENKQDWLKIAKKHGKRVNLREGKTRWLGMTERIADCLDRPVTIVFDIMEETRDKNGQLLAIPDIAIETYWTNVFVPADTASSIESAREATAIINAYHQHGESEQFHSEYKTDLDMERLPSGKFATNALITLLGMVAFNVLRICGQESLVAISRLEREGELVSVYRKPNVSRRRIRSVLLDIMYLASHVTSSARYAWISFGCYCQLSGAFRELYRGFALGG
jgi:hypothetical protein